MEARPNVVRPASGDRYVTLQFFVPIRVAARISYSARIERAGKTVLRLEQIRSADGVGNFALVCPRDFFTRGSYTLAVEEYDKEKNEQTAAFLFPFDVIQ